jgi:hypothetical protein
MSKEIQTNETVNKFEILENIKKEVLIEAEYYGSGFGDITYRLAKALYEKTKNLGLADTHYIYEAVADYLGMSIKTIKQMVWIYGKLDKYGYWHNGTALMKFRLFQIAYYLSKHTTEFEEVLKKVYSEIAGNFKMSLWFEKASYKEIIEWLKMRFETYLKVFKKGKSFYHYCEVCNGELKDEDKGKKWDFIPIHFSCLEMLKENEKEKIAVLRNTIAKNWREEKIKVLEEENQKLKKQLLETVNELNELKARRKKKLKKIVETIDN